MVDTALYTNAGGAKQFMRKTHLLANNLANVNTVGFHGDFGTLVNSKTSESGMQTRIIPQTGEIYTDQRSGPMNHTGRSLDVAIDGDGFFAVQNQKGNEGYTRAGNFDITDQGLLVTQKGDIVLGEDGVITIPPSTQVRIDNKGMVTAQLKGESENTVAQIGRLKLVQPDLNTIEKGQDGLFYGKGPGAAIQQSPDVKLLPETLEGSNVEAIDALVQMVDMSRQFDFQTKLMHTIEENATRANSILELR